MINNIKDREELLNIVTQKDCTELKKLILENPEAPLLIFSGEEAWSGEYSYECASEGYVQLQELTLYGGGWLDRDYYEDALRDAMGFDDQYESLSDEEFDKEVEKIMNETAFVKAIVIYVG